MPVFHRRARRKVAGVGTRMHYPAYSHFTAGTAFCVSLFQRYPNDPTHWLRQRRCSHRDP